LIGAATSLYSLASVPAIISGLAAGPVFFPESTATEHAPDQLSSLPVDGVLAVIPDRGSVAVSPQNRSRSEHKNPLIHWY
jgi:hypothetical protein